MFGQNHKTKWTWNCDVTYSRGSTFSLVLSVKQLFLGFKFISHLKCDYKQLPWVVRDPQHWILCYQRRSLLPRSKTHCRCVLEAKTFQKKEVQHVEGSGGERRRWHLLEVCWCRRMWEDLMLVQNCVKQQVTADLI